MIGDDVAKGITVRLFKEDMKLIEQEATELGLKPGTYLRHLVHMYYKGPVLSAKRKFGKLNKEEKELLGYDEDGNLLD